MSLTDQSVSCLQLLVSLPANSFFSDSVQAQCESETVSMVVYHMVWIKLKEGVSTSSPEVTKFLTESAERLGPIHGVLHVRAGTRPCLI